ncbi:MAG: tetratricopeptide repeat protein [Planctomycetes bacterium]|nr:tetratricopeptide repeat protein [Planctomycetota bacterium]
MAPRFLLLLTSLAALSGCASLPIAGKDAESAKSREEAVAAFDRKRDAAQLAAARDRAAHGDVETAEKLLIPLIERNPDHPDARLLLADLWASQDRHTEAEQQLRLILQRDGKNAQAHYSLGLLLDITGRTEEAAHHFHRAVELAPDNTAYRLAVAAAKRPNSIAQGVALGDR